MMKQNHVIQEINIDRMHLKLIHKTKPLMPEQYRNMTQALYRIFRPNASGKRG